MDSPDLIARAQRRAQRGRRQSIMQPSWQWRLWVLAV